MANSESKTAGCRETSKRNMTVPGPKIIRNGQTISEIVYNERRRRAF